ncbi:hypothetical protein [Methylobacterium sp. A54F]
MDDPTPVAVTVEACGESRERFRWHLTDRDGVSVRVSPESYGSAEDADEAGREALGAFGAAQQG